MLYDGARLRYVFNLTAASFVVIGGLLDCLVLYYVKDMDLYKEPDEQEFHVKKEEKKLGEVGNGVRNPESQLEMKS